MKAIEFTRYGAPDVLRLKEVDKPAPGDNEILIRILATTVTATECTFRRGKPFITRLFTGLLWPKITRLGEELAGEVEALGRGVKLFKIGDKVFGTAGTGFGANAEYICLPENAVLAPKPDNLSFEEAAANVDGFLTALPFLRDTANIRRGQKVLIYGASGSVGSAAVQIAGYFGAEVTGVCSTANLDLVRSLGAGHVIDYTIEEFPRSGESYDIIFDTVGKTTFARCKSALKEDGIFLEAAIAPKILPQVLWTRIAGGQRVLIAATGLRPPADRTRDLMLLKQLLESARIKPVIDRYFPLEEIAEAHRYVDTGRKKGNVVITV